MGQSPNSEECNQEGIGTPFLQGNADFGQLFPKPRSYCDCAVKLAKPGDLLFSVRAPVGAINVADRTYGIGRGLCAIHSDTDMHATYVRYMMELAKRALLSVATGSTYEAVSVEQVASVQFLKPTWSEQKAIAIFLDRETAKIDALISKQERLITLLAEKRRGATSHVVTRGLDPNMTLQNSDTSSTEFTPAHWKIGPIKRFLKILDEQRIPLSAEERSHRRGKHPYYGASGIIDYIDNYIFNEDLILVSEDGANLLNRSTPIALTH